MGKTNRQWHEQHRMPEGATIEERIVWHLEHVKECACRPIPKGIREAMKARGLTATESDPKRPPK